MPNDAPSIQILLTLRFKQDLRKLAKRYRSIRQDLAPLIEQFQQGETPGDRISGNKYQVIKARLKNSNIQKGKSAGYRVIYYLKTETTIILVTIYSKSDLSDLSNKLIEGIIQQFEREF
ncbi:MAG: type II toxin-antitoxin system RelE/ParE family toxin [Cyanobacteria bacterium P01_A01_bin.83]